MDAGWRIKEQWGQTLPLLLTAPTEEEFDGLLDAFVERRAKMGYDIVAEEWIRLVADAKRRLGI